MRPSQGVKNEDIFAPKNGPFFKTKRRDSIGLTLDTADLILSTLKNAAQAAPVPHLSQAAILALGIVNTIQGVRDNNKAYKRLGNDACGLVYTVLRLWEEREKDGKETLPELDAHLEELLVTLKSIEKFAQEQRARGMVLRLVSSKSDLVKVQEYREKLRQALDIFGLQSSISILDTVTKILERQEALLSNLQERAAQVQADSSPTPSPAPTPIPAQAPSPPMASVTPTLPVSPPTRSGFSNIQSTHGTFTYIGGDQTTSTVTNNNNSVNSGNITTITTTNSGNNTSVTHIGSPRRSDWLPHDPH